MERTTSLTDAKQALRSNFIGPEELTLISDKMAIKVPSEIPTIPFSLEELVTKRDDYLLILGTSHMQNGELISLKSLRNQFGINPEIAEPCFYNQDWYLKEKFIEKPLEQKWFLIRKNIFQESRGKNPDEIENQYSFPSAILCAYSFFVYWFHANECLWEHDFVWCNDLDHNDDRIYVGKYHDINGFNKNGFSIHRHLRIMENYGCIDFV